MGSAFFYRLLKFCEEKSGKAQEIKNKMVEIDNKLNNAEIDRSNAEFQEFITISKEEQINNLHKFIEILSYHYRTKDYETVDAMFDRINL